MSDVLRAIVQRFTFVVVCVCACESCAIRSINQVTKWSQTGIEHQQHWHITEKNRTSFEKNCNIKLSRVHNDWLYTRRLSVKNESILICWGSQSIIILYPASFEVEHEMNEFHKLNGAFNIIIKSSPKMFNMHTFPGEFMLHFYNLTSIWWIFRFLWSSTLWMCGKKSLLCIEYQYYHTQKHIDGRFPLNQ